MREYENFYPITDKDFWPATILELTFELWTCKTNPHNVFPWDELFGVIPSLRTLIVRPLDNNDNAGTEEITWTRSNGQLHKTTSDTNE
jgi:hypothetical protein